MNADVALKHGPRSRRPWELRKNVVSEGNDSVIQTDLEPELQSKADWEPDFRKFSAAVCD